MDREIQRVLHFVLFLTQVTMNLLILIFLQFSVFGLLFLQTDIAPQKGLLKVKTVNKRGMVEKR